MSKSIKQPKTTTPAPQKPDHESFSNNKGPTHNHVLDAMRTHWAMASEMSK